MNENENQVLDAVSEDWDDMDFSDLADTEVEPGTEAPAAESTNPILPENVLRA